jgi:phosphate starvation-inducible PhoH-like protein
VYRVSTQDGASTRACGEHLWFVTTPGDRRHGKAGRVVQTSDMIGRLRSAHARTYELPVVQPVRMAPSHVPMDAYALGLLLGDGCLTTSTTPSFSTRDPELAQALEGALPDIELRATRTGDYTLRHEGYHRGGVLTENPVTAVLRELGLAGTRSTTKFVPLRYLVNDVEVRLGVLQGLLDTDGGPVVQDGRTCRVQYSTCSNQLREDVVWLVRSLGGVAYARTRPAEGRQPGFAGDRPVPHRSDAQILDIRGDGAVPAGQEEGAVRRDRRRPAHALHRQHRARG